MCTERYGDSKLAPPSGGRDRKFGSSSETRLCRHMHCMIATEQVMTDRYDIVERTGRSEEYNDERKREYDPAVMFFHPGI